MSMNGYAVGVIIPAYNEENSIKCIIDELLNLNYIDRILVVDDGSKDKTALISALEGADVISLPCNKGKAFAMKRGYEAMETNILIFLDGDIIEGTDQLIELIKPICEQRAEAVIARLPMTPGKGGFGLVKALASKGMWYLTGQTYSSVLSGQRAILRNILRPEFFEYKGFGIEFGMTLDMISNNTRILEVDINMRHNVTGRDLKGFIHRYRQFSDILKVIITKLKERLYSNLKKPIRGAR